MTLAEKIKSRTMSKREWKMISSYLRKANKIVAKKLGCSNNPWFKIEIKI